MSNEYIAPAVVLSDPADGIGASVSSRSPRSAPASPFVCPGFCACAADRTSKEASAPMPKSLPHRAIAPCRDAFRLLDILLLPHTASRGGGAQKSGMSCIVCNLWALYIYQRV